GYAAQYNYIAVPFTNGPEGTVHVAANGLIFTAGGSSSGAFVGDPGTTLTFRGDFAFAAQTPAAPDSSITADAVSFDNGGTMAIACPYTVRGSTYVAYGSVVRFTGPVDVAGSDLIGGPFAGALDFTAAWLEQPLTFRNVAFGGRLLSSADVH